MTQKSIVAAALTFLAASSGVAEPPDLAAALAGHRYSLRLEDGRLAGDGAALLTSAARTARYVVVGEDHGLAETSQLTEALFRELRPLGFETYVTEVGPWSARRLVELAEQSRDGRAFAEFFARYPFSIPFAPYREEAALLTTVAALSDAAAPIWGIDQEFFFAPQMLLDELARRAEGEARDHLEALAEADREAYRSVVANRDPSVPSFMSRPLPETWTDIRRHFASDDEALAMLEALEKSREVYGHFFAGEAYLNNHRRARLMKANLGRYFARYGQDRRLLVKLGANHVMRGMSPLGISDAGNFLAELAALHGEESLHLLVVATSGTQNAWLPFLPEEALTAPIDVESPAYAPLRPLLRALPAAEGWSLVDLRPLRADVKRWAADSPKLEDAILGYDAVVVIAKARAAELFATLLPENGP